MTLRGGTRARLLALLGLVVACKPDPAPTVTPSGPAPAADAPALATSEGITAWLAVEGVGATEAEALTQARDQLAARLLGDPAWQQLFDVEVHDPARDPGPVVTARGEGEVRVAIGLSRVRAVEVVSAMEMGEAAVAGPEAWRETLYGYLSAHAAVHVCERRRELFEAECDPGDAADADAALAELAAAVTFAPEFGGGLPTDAAGKVLRVPSVFAMHFGAPVAGVPIVVRTDAARSETSNALGEVRIEGDPARGVTVTVDADALLGPLASAWPDDHALKLAPRPLDATRYVVFAEKGKRSAELLRVVGNALTNATGGRVGPDGAAVGRDLAPDAAGRVEWLRSQTGRGSDPVDYVVMVGGRWGFASRMGSGRIWYEASGFIEVARAWDGKSVARIEEKVRANGVGDEQAEAAARDELVRTLVSAIRKAEGSPWASDASERISRTTVPR